MWPSDASWKVHARCNIKTPVMGGVKTFVNLHANAEKKDSKNANEAIAKFNFKYDDFHVGFATAHDLEKVTDMRGQVAWNKTKNV